ncbi:MAG: hypothetical protein ACP5PA_04705 [Elusimicrobiales bacterium]
MTYSIWTDTSFYFYLILVIVSIVVIVSSIGRLLDEMGKAEESMEVDTDEKSLSADELEGKASIEKVDEERIVFEKSSNTIFDSPSSSQALGGAVERKDDEKAIIFLKNLNENISRINDELSKINDLEKKIEEIERNIKGFKNSIKDLIKDEISKGISQIDTAKPVGDNNLTPKNISKYLEDIVEEFDSLDKEVIRKRISVIVEDLKKIAR